MLSLWPGLTRPSIFFAKTSCERDALVVASSEPVGARQRASQNQLGLGHQCHELSFLGFQARLPDLGPASAMKRPSSGYDRRALLGRAHEIRLALDRDRAIGVCRKAYEGRRAAGRVCQRHGAAAVHSVTQSTEI